MVTAAVTKGRGRRIDGLRNGDSPPVARMVGFDHDPSMSRPRRAASPFRARLRGVEAKIPALVHKVDRSLQVGLDSLRDEIAVDDMGDAFSEGEFE